MASLSRAVIKIILCLLWSCWLWLPWHLCMWGTSKLCQWPSNSIFHM